MIALEDVTSRLAAAGFVAAHDEAEELLDCAAGDGAVLASMLERRLRGEPLAWITGFTSFCGVRVRLDPGVYVPRWQSEPLARRAALRLPPKGSAVDLCTGSGAIAMVVQTERPNARVVATDLDEVAVNCAASNGVKVYCGDLFAPLPSGLEGRVDVVVGVVPYVPTKSMSLLPRDTFVFESTLAYDGGDDGAEILRRVIRESTLFLRAGGALILELGGDEAEILQSDLLTRGFTDVNLMVDDDGDVRGLDATFDA